MRGIWGIIIKDVLAVKRTLALYMALLIVLAVTMGETIIGFAMFYAMMLSVNTMAVSERAHFDRLIPALPVTSCQCVLSKYLFTYVNMGLMLALSSVVLTITQGHVVLTQDTALYVALSMLVYAVMMPFIFWLGVEKGRAAYLSALVVQMLAIAGMQQLLEQQAVLNSQMLLLLCFAAAIGANAVSILASVKLMDRRILA